MGAGMEKTVYEDYKYVMQDTAFLYVGCKYTLAEIMENEEILYRFRKVVAESFLREADREDTLETMLYYLKPESFLLQVLKQMNAQVRVSILKEKKTWGGGKQLQYETRFMKIRDLVKMNKEQKEEAGLFIQELKVGKLALLTV